MIGWLLNNKPEALSLYIYTLVHILPVLRQKDHTRYVCNIGAAGSKVRATGFCLMDGTWNVQRRGAVVKQVL